jgi:hypothetical protein
MVNDRALTASMIDSLEFVGARRAQCKVALVVFRPNWA